MQSDSDSSIDLADAEDAVSLIFETRARGEPMRNPCNPTPARHSTWRMLKTLYR
jgi:hypothetical protein